jgi:hypothetical protein
MAEANYIDHEHKPQFQRSFSEEFKKRKIRELERNITSVPDICKTYYVSRTSVYKWIYKYSVMAKKQVKRQIKRGCLISILIIIFFLSVLRSYLCDPLWFKISSKHLLLSE